MSFYDDQESWLTAMIKGREKSQIGRKTPPLTHTGLWGLLLVIGPNIQHRPRQVPFLLISQEFLAISGDERAGEY
jgi:hypothetical protein